MATTSPTRLPGTPRQDPSCNATDAGVTTLTLECTERGDGAPVPRELRVSDVERQAVARRLERALRDGRLTIVEFDERTQAAYAARTRGELDELTEDLPPDIW
jgi:hypothetical protein